MARPCHLLPCVGASQGKCNSSKECEPRPDPRVPGRYAARSFGEAYANVVASLSALALLLFLLGIAIPALVPVCTSAIVVALALLAVRVWLHREPDQVHTHAPRHPYRGSAPHWEASPCRL